MKDTLRNIAKLYHGGEVRMETCLDAIKHDPSFIQAMAMHCRLETAYIQAIKGSPRSKTKIGRDRLNISEIVEQLIQLRAKPDKDYSTEKAIARYAKCVRNHKELVATYGGDVEAINDLEIRYRQYLDLAKDPDTAAMGLLSAALVILYADEEAAKTYNQLVFDINCLHAVDGLFREFGLPNHKKIDRTALSIRLEAMHRSDPDEFGTPGNSRPIQSYNTIEPDVYHVLLNMAPWYGQVDYSGKDLIGIISNNGSIPGLKL